MTKMLKNWCGLSRSADPSHIYLSKANSGLNIPTITSCYKKAQVSRYSQLMQSRDSTCRFLAERQHSQDKWTHKRFKPTAQVITVMTKHLGAARSTVAAEARLQVDKNEEEEHLSHASALAKERDLVTLKENGDDLWSSTVPKLPENHFAFAMAASVDSLPHNSNLCRWRMISSDLCTICCKIGRHHKQTLAHVLSHCQAAIQHERYNRRHDHILEILYRHLKESLPNESTAVADLPGQLYVLPTALLTDLRPDIVVYSSKHIHLFKLTVCWEANFESAKQRKESKYLHLLEEARSNGMAATLSTI